MKSRTIVSIAICGLFLTAAAVVSAGAPDSDPQHKPANLKNQLEELKLQRVETAQLACDSMAAAFEADRTTLEQVLAAINRLGEARLAVAKTGKEKLAVLQEQLHRLKQMEKRVADLYKVGSADGDKSQMAMVTRERQTAQIKLLEYQLFQFGYLSAAADGASSDESKE